MTCDNRHHTRPSECLFLTSHVKRTIATKKRKSRACQTSAIAHPGRAPEGKTAAIGVEIIITLYTAIREA
ncbi:hypothetical protein GGR52DRAFT_526372 [Hypoxylon sp. FL1284]|nr:hypothetical protein GGR52DRAFT_526372 [Hypoxylon sp. FL1284]